MPLSFRTHLRVLVAKSFIKQNIIIIIINGDSPYKHNPKL